MSAAMSVYKARKKKKAEKAINNDMGPPKPFDMSFINDIRVIAFSNVIID